ncbi:MAG: hypothetical protein GX621_15110, partial [Pirellulaceae bacterium]|nr:hypothetical protein [Pirellulaceae bacterium]
MSRLPQVFPIALSSLAWRIGLCALLILSQGNRVLAQANGSADYRAYTLKYKSAAEVEPALRQALASQAAGAGTHLVFDARTNQLLLRGPEAAQQIAREWIASVDRPSAPQPLPPPQTTTPTTDKPLVQPYPCPRPQLGQVAQQLRGVYAESTGVRVAVDDQGSQLFILASPAVHADIQRRLAAMGILAARPVAPAAEAARPATRQEQFVALSHSRIEQVEPKLRELLGARLRPVEPR